MRALVIAAAALLAAAPAWGQKLDRLNLLTQDEFKLLSEDLIGAFAYRPMTHATQLGTLGFDIGVGATGARLKNPDLLQKASSDDTSESLFIPTARVNVGLPLGFDIGAALGQVPDTDIRFYNVMGKWAFLQGDMTTPAIALRASYTRMSGVDQMSVDTFGADLSISKGFAFVTPYAGVGVVHGKGDPKGNFGLKTETADLTKVFGGVSFKIALIDLTIEADKTGDVTAWSGKLALRF